MTNGDGKIRLLVAGACMLFVWVFLASASANVMADTPAAQPAPDDGALKLIVIELFFLAVGLLIAAFLGFLIWRSWRRKKEKTKE